VGRRAGDSRTVAIVAGLLTAALMATLPATPSVAATVSGDFNADGFADVAIGAPGEDVPGRTGAGAVHVLYSQGVAGSETNFVWNAGNQQFVGARSGDQAGIALATGDFNCDAVADLAIGIPGLDSDTGGVRVLYGGPAPGNLSTGTQLLPRPGSSYNYRFGVRLAAGDFGQGSGSAAGCDDLAIGGSGRFRRGESIHAGEVLVAYGNGPSGFATALQGILSGSETSPATGPLLAANLVRPGTSSSSYDELVVGVPFWDIGSKANAGAAFVYRGQASGLSPQPHRYISQDEPGVPDKAEAGDQFGNSLAAANFGDDFYADLAVGVRRENRGQTRDTGATHVFYGGSENLSGAKNQFFTQNSPDMPGAAEAGDLFGYSLAAGNFGRTNQGDLAIGVSGEDVGSVSSAGAVHILYSRRIGTADRLSATNSRLFTQNSAGIAGAAERGDGFGTTLGVGNFGFDSRTDLSVGVPREDLGSVRDAGSVHLLYGRPPGISGEPSQAINQDTPGVLDGGDANDLFGYSLAPP
jgi:FG-GAP repeat protein